LPASRRGNTAAPSTSFRLAAIVQAVKKPGLDGTASKPEKALKSGERVALMARMGVGVMS
jgi:hypothetical protein